MEAGLLEALALIQRMQEQEGVVDSMVVAVAVADAKERKMSLFSPELEGMERRGL